MNDGANFDPRHDARFQRGYQPGNDPIRRARTDVPVPAQADAPSNGPTAADDDDDLDLDPDLDLAGDKPRNPFLVALWILGPALVVAGLTLQVQANFRSFSFNGAMGSSGEMPFEMLLLQISYTLAPTMVTAGLTTVLGLLFWQAFRWRKPSA